MDQPSMGTKMQTASEASVTCIKYMNQPSMETKLESSDCVPLTCTESTKESSMESILQPEDSVSVINIESLNSSSIVSTLAPVYTMSNKIMSAIESMQDDAVQTQNADSTQPALSPTLDFADDWLLTDLINEALALGILIYHSFMKVFITSFIDLIRRLRI